MATGLRSLALVSFACVCKAVGEGDDLMMELAGEVLSNKQALLSIPWEIYKDTPSFRDVGYVGDYPIRDSAATEIHLGSLWTGRELQGFPPNVLIGRALVKDSLNVTQPPAKFRYAGKGGEEIRHLNGLTNPVGDLTVWQWQRMRWSAAKTWLDYWGSRSSVNKLAIIHSSGDVLYGGCDENTILYKYNQIVNASGVPAKIVVAAELSPYPEDIGWNFDRANWTEARRQTTLAGLGVPADWTSSYADCTNRTLGPCTSAKTYHFLNSGFIMGEAEALFDMASELSSPVHTGCQNRKVNEYFLKNPGTVTADYAGTLSMSLHNMRPGNLPVQVGADREKPYLRSKVTDSAVCFVHGNGNSFAALQELARELKG